MHMKAAVNDIGDLFQHYGIFSPKIIVCFTWGTCVLNKGTETEDSSRQLSSSGARPLGGGQVFRTTTAGAGPFLMQSPNSQNHNMS